MPYGIYAKCPHCGKTAFGRVAVKEQFGFRTIREGHTIPQSYCKSCRSYHIKKHEIIELKRKVS